MNYAAIKAAKIAGRSPSVEEIDQAIKAQKVVVGEAICKVAQLAGEHAAAHEAPFPLECEEAHSALVEALADSDHQSARLLKLFRWRTLKAQGLR